MLCIGVLCVKNAEGRLRPPHSQEILRNAASGVDYRHCPATLDGLCSRSSLRTSFSICDSPAFQGRVKHRQAEIALIRRNFFARSVHEVAPELVGATLTFKDVGGVIVEVEAYHHTDPAAHSFRGPTERNRVMFGPPGYAYVYRSYGIHWCLNFVCEPKGSASAVLVRALAPTQGLAVMRRRRGLTEERLLCAGPGRVCQALGITGAHDGLALDQPPFELFARTADVAVAVGPRIGITKAADNPWRYGLEGSRFLSKPFKTPITGRRR